MRSLARRGRRCGFAGDVTATTEKASALIAQAINEIGDPAKFPEGETARRTLREVAHKGWMGITTAADRYLCATEGVTARGTRRVAGVYKQLGSRAFGQYGVAYELLHVGCGYRDSEGCSPASVRAALQGAGAAIRAVESRVLAMQRHRKAGKKCPPEAA